MSKLNDEILNKLVDNELNSSEIDELYSLIKEDDELLGKTKAMQMVDDVLKTMEVIEAPKETTEIIMSKISEALIYKERKNGFFKAIIGVFSGVCVLLLGYFFTSNSNVSSDSYFSIINKKIAEIIPSFSYKINSDFSFVIISFVALLILISLSLLYEEHKSFKQKLDNIL